MTGQKEHCDHECVCNKYIDHTNTGATPGRLCNGETWCFKPCSHDTRFKNPDLDTIKRTSDLPKIIPPLPVGDTRDLKVWKEYWVKHDARIRNTTLDEVIKLSIMIEENETELWERAGRPKNDGYVNGSHSGYGRALRDMRRWIDQIKRANGGLKI